MPFIYADAPHMRKHGPSGYVRYQSYKDWLRDEFTFRCVYCLERERWYPNGHAGFGVDHVKPKGQAEFAHLVCHYPNLVYACNRCNSAKNESILINPYEVAFGDHLKIDDDGEIIGLTIEGRRVINILGLDRQRSTQERKKRLHVLCLHRQYPANGKVRALYLAEFGFPEDLPDLSVLFPAENTKPDGTSHSYYRQRAAGILPETYGVWLVSP
jgi:hypothetical protein